MIILSEDLVILFLHKMHNFSGYNSLSIMYVLNISVWKINVLFSLIYA